MGAVEKRTGFKVSGIVFSAITLITSVFVFTGCIHMPGDYRRPAGPVAGGSHYGGKAHAGTVFYLDRISRYRGGDFAIRNSLGQVMYKIRGNLYSRGRRLSVSSADGRLLYSISSRPSKYGQNYRIYSHGRWVAKIYRKRSRNNEQFYVNSRNGNDYKVRGNFTGRTYAFYHRGRRVAQTLKRSGRFSSGTVIEIDRYQNNIVILLTSVAIDMDNMIFRRR